MKDLWELFQFWTEGKKASIDTSADMMNFMAMAAQQRQESREAEERFNHDREQRRWDEIFKRISLNSIKKTKERIKNPQSIWGKRRDRK